MTVSCSLCGKKTGGFFDGNIVTKNSIDFVRSKGIKVPDSICRPCFISLRDGVARETTPIEVNTRQISEILSSIRITTYPPEPNLEYTYRTIVTSRAAIGTGVISQVLSTWTDFFGSESETYNEKFRKGEEICIKKLQHQAIECDANAIVGLQTTYTELTSGHGMLLVCMVGTAINIKDEGEGVKERYDTLLLERQQLTLVQNNAIANTK